MDCAHQRFIYCARRRPEVPGSGRTEDPGRIRRPCLLEQPPWNLRGELPHARDGAVIERVNGAVSFAGAYALHHHLLDPPALYLDVSARAAAKEVEHLGQARNRGTAPEVEAAEVGDGHLAGGHGPQIRVHRNSGNCRVVVYDHYAICGGVDVELDCVGACLECEAERFERILRNRAVKPAVGYGFWCLSQGASWLVAHLNIHPLLPSIHVSRMRDRDVGADQPTDLELIERWKRGDSRAATLIVERHADALARYASSQGEREELDELVQDTFVRAFGSLENFRGESALRTWLFTIARRLILDRRRAARRARVTVPADEGSAVTEVTPLDVMLADEAEERVRLAIERLTPMQREVFTLRVSEGMSYADIARLVGSTDGAARVHYHHAMRAVKEFLEDA